MSLSEKSNDEIRKMLVEHGIKHGPVLDSTRKQYEKKLEKAMEKSSMKTSSDKTYYREEEETTYITYHSPVNEGFVDSKLVRRGILARDDDKESLQDTNGSQSTFQMTKTVNHSVTQSSIKYNRQGVKSGGGKSKLVWLLLLLLLLLVFAAVLWYLWS